MLAHSPGCSLARAWQLYTQAAAADATCARAFLGLANLDLLERRNRSAKERLERAHTLDPDDPEVLLGWAASLGAGRRRVRAGP
jgi:Flp pilus assembly protein TadD